MGTLLLVISILSIYFSVLHKKIHEDRKECIWIYSISFLCIGMTVMNMLFLGLGGFIHYLNETIGEITKYVVEI